MKLKKTWSGLSIFLASLALSVPLSFLTSPLYDDIFKVYSGSWIFDIGSYVGTTSLVYVFLISLLYRGLSKNYKGLTLFYFVLIPFLIFSVSGTDVLIAGFLLLLAGFYLGKLLSGKSKNSRV